MRWCSRDVGRYPAGMDMGVLDVRPESLLRTGRGGTGNVDPSLIGLHGVRIMAGCLLLALHRDLEESEEGGVLFIADHQEDVLTGDHGRLIIVK